MRASKVWRPGVSGMPASGVLAADLAAVDPHHATVSR
jgi:hypothetical protein